MVKKNLLQELPDHCDRLLIDTAMKRLAFALAGDEAGSLQFLEKQRAHHGTKPAGDPGLSALTGFCHVILNLNEFVYVP